MLSKRKSSIKPFFVLSTTPTRKEAVVLAQKLVDQKLAACVNLIYPVTSFFYWKKKQERVREALLIIKTIAPNFKAIQKLFQDYHSYEVPELIGWPITKGNAPYLNWLQSSVLS